MQNLRPSCLIVILFGMVFASVLPAQDLRLQAVPAGTKLADLPKVLPPSVSVQGSFSDEGDYYLTPQKKRVSLMRATGSMAVTFVSDPAAALKKLGSRSRVVAHRVVGRVSLRGRPFHLLSATERDGKLDRDGILGEPDVVRAFPVLVDRATHRRMIATDELLVRFVDGTKPAQISAFAGRLGLDVIAEGAANPLGVWCLRIRNARNADPLSVCRKVGASAGVLWAQPNFIREIRLSADPANPFFPDQQALSNTGQNGAVAGADVKAAAAWQRTTGSNGVVIAIIDDGVDTSHPALRIFTNAGESGDGKETNGIDDDGDGRIDDVHGWDFAGDDNNPSPVGGNGHGTGCAGIAASQFGAGYPTAGIAPDCTVLPVKIADDNGDFTTDEIIGNALLYAARHADVLSNSWGGGSPGAFIEDAIDYAVTLGRGGKGCPVFFATGNGASTWYQGGSRARIFLNGFGGSYHISFLFLQGPGSGGENAVRVDNVCLLDADGYTHKTGILADEDFEGFVPGWFSVSTSGVTSTWEMSFTNALTGTGGFFSAVSPVLQSGQIAGLASPYVTMVGDETLAFAVSVSVPSDPEAGLYFFLLDADFNLVAGAGPLNGVPEIVTDTTYPASYANAIAVGAATDRDLRSDYSQYGGKIDFLAPSNGGWNDIATLDPVGAVGWTDTDYKLNFGGTSSATPLAAGIAALMLTQNPNLTATEVRAILHSSCDKIGGVAYDADGKNPLYGYGRVNARRAVGTARPLLSVGDVDTPQPPMGVNGTATFTLTLSDPAIHDVTVDFGTHNGTALAGIDYDEQSGVAMFPAGTVSQTVDVTIHGGQLTKPNLRYHFDLDNPAGADLDREFALGRIFALDSDADGMPDFWEAAFQYDLENPADAAPDDDGDGFSNVKEFLAGTDPRSSSSRPYISRIFTDIDGVHVMFPTSLDRFYQIEFTADLASGSWQVLDADLPGTGGIYEVIDAIAPGVPTNRFYRVKAGP